MVSDQRRAYIRKWHQENREHVRAYREATKEQRNARRRANYRANEVERESAKKAAAEYRAANPHRRREADLKRVYGISRVEYDRMLAEQCGRCAICGNLPAEGKHLRVDHCHNSHLVRGLLCDSCNLGLGKFYDNPDLLAAAAKYLRERGN
jgi:hypothetical protein